MPTVAYPPGLNRFRTLKHGGAGRPIGRLLALLLFVATVGVDPAGAGLLHERLAAELDTARPGELVTGLVMLSEQIDFARLESDMTARGLTTRGERHEYVVRAAQELANRTQPRLLAMLMNETQAGRAHAYQPFWVTNAVSVEGTPELFTALALRGDVGMVYPIDQVDLRLGVDDPRETAPTRLWGSRISPATLADGLVAINVEPAWNQGYAGRGRLVCDFDTGADGNHPAFGSRWRGLEPAVRWWEAWKDPTSASQFPYDAASHGTHTLGLMVARPPGQDPIGVAYEAKWIAARVLGGPTIPQIIACYQWAVDPDSIPSTIADVPDVINNSWGTSGNCEQTFWNAIDLVEAAGIVNVIAVDNTGPGYASVNSPESRADTPYRNFCVGNVDPHQDGYPINPSSSRGPSPCDSSSIKPELTAPGTQIYSTVPDDAYGVKTGTSMACPHVSGAVAILRSVNPDLTVDQVKEALMTTASDRGDPGEDNAYGWGVLDVGAAVDYVLIHHPPSPPPRSLAQLAPGDSVVQLSWLPPSGVVPANPLLGYNVYRAGDQDPYPETPVAAVDSALTLFTDAGRSSGSYRYIVTATYQDSSESRPSNEVVAVVPDPAGVEARPPSSAELNLRVSPNPFHGQTEVRLAAAGGRVAGVVVFDTAGRRVCALKQEQAGSDGQALYRWNAQDDAGRQVPAGVYFLSATAGEQKTGRRVILVR